tara:strand:- start:49542 stop:50078 length:537 start_codon:yes stop_codon:yes gene_type:complete
MNPKAASLTTDKRKVALIPVLVGILIWNLTSSSDKAGSGAADNSATLSEQTLTEADGLIRQLRSSQDRTQRKNWPQFELEDMVKFDPFSVSGALAERSGFQAAEQLIASQPEAESHLSPDAADEKADPIENPVRAVTIGRNGAAALIDSRIMRVGDQLEEGIRIVAIERNAIIVEMVE